MKTGYVCVPCIAFVIGLPHGSPADEGLTLESALTRARARSPALLAARGRVAEVEARLRTRPPLRDNPTVESARGDREDGGADFEIGLSQTLELGGRGRARRSIDEAAVAREAAEAEAGERAVLSEVRNAFLRGLHSRERVRQATSLESDAAELHRIAKRRHESGDIAALELNVAASGLARARAAVKVAEAAEAAAHGQLRGLLDLPPAEPLSLSGDLGQEQTYDTDSLTAAVGDRPEIRILEAQLREADAEVRLGRGLAWPEVTPGIRYERDEGDRVLWAGLTFTLPVFDHGQQVRAAGRARSERLRAEIEGRKRALQNQVQAALALHGLRLAAAKELSANADRLSENESLARRSYDVGQIGLAELLLLRRETAEARQEWLDSLLELAQARAELDSFAGGVR
jgi:outer membrane protein, heavy metal efflux system